MKRKLALALLTLGIFAEIGTIDTQAMTIISMWSNCSACISYEKAKSDWDSRNRPHHFRGWLGESYGSASVQGITGISAGYWKKPSYIPCDPKKHVALQMFHNNLGNGS